MFYITFINTHHKFYLEPLTAIVSVKQIVKVIVLVTIRIITATIITKTIISVSIMIVMIN